MNTTSESFQGWTNYETWMVALWLDNDSKLYKLAQIITTAEGLKGFMNEAKRKPYNCSESPDAFYSDMKKTSFKKVNWQEIAEKRAEE